MKNENGRINPGLAIVLALVAICILLLNSQACFWSPGMYLDHSGWFSMPWRFFSFSALIQLILAVWVGVDAQKRGSNGYFWGLLVFFTSIVGLLVYLLWITDVMEKISRDVNTGRAPAPAADPVVVDAVLPSCPACGGEVEEDFKACPACGASLRCSGCDKPIRKGWKVCPWCTTPQAGH